MSAVIPVLNKTYVHTTSDEIPLSTTARTLFNTKEFVIQAGKAFSITSQHVCFPINAGSVWYGVYVGMSIQVNGVWYDLGNSGYTIGMTLGGLRPERYYDTKYIDLISENIVPDDASYRISVRVRGVTHQGTGLVNAPAALINNGDGNRGIEIQEVTSQNNGTIIIQEKDR